MAGHRRKGTQAGAYYVDLMVATGLSGVLVFSSFQMHWLLRIIALVVFVGGIYYKVVYEGDRWLSGRAFAYTIGAVLVGFGAALLVSLVTATQFGQVPVAGWIVFAVLAALIFAGLLAARRFSAYPGPAPDSRGPDGMPRG